MGISEAAARDLSRICGGRIERDVPLAALSRWRIGGAADLVLRPASGTEVAALRRYFYDRRIAHVVIGETSNLLFHDAGLRVPCIQIGAAMADVTVAGEVVSAEAGLWIPALARRIMQAGLTGAEHICGIPGTVGGLICMNGGSQRKGIGSAVVCVTAVDRRGEMTERLAEACGFAYRLSVYQTNDEIITSARLRFRHGDRREIRREMLAILADRRRKFPRAQPNCGSVFKSNPAMYDEVGPPGAVIERLGFKGRRIGGARVSPDHANFIVNAGGARATDVMALIAEISETVLRTTGHRMEVEVRLVMPDGAIVPADATLTEGCSG